jgi:archaellum component FlaC
MAKKGGDKDAEAIEEKIEKLNAAYQRFTKAADAVAKKQRLLFEQFEQLLDAKKTSELKKKIL